MVKNFGLARSMTNYSDSHVMGGFNYEEARHGGGPNNLVFLTKQRESFPLEVFHELHGNIMEL